MILGLPGNPASAFVCAHLLLKPLLYRLTGRDAADATQLSSAQLDGGLPANGERETFLRAQFMVDGDGVVRVSALPAQDSSLVSMLAVANCLIRRRPGAPSTGAHDIVEQLTIDGARRNAIEGEALFGMREAGDERAWPERLRERLRRIPFEGEAR